MDYMRIFIKRQYTEVINILFLHSDSVSYIYIYQTLLLTYLL